MLTLDQGRAIAALMADKLFEAMRGGTPTAQGKSLLGTDPLAHRGPVAQIQFSGGVSEFIYGNEAKKFGDLGPLLADEIRARADAFCPRLEPPLEGIRATVVGASQYTIQVAAPPSTSRRSMRCRCATCRSSRRRCRERATIDGAVVARAVTDALAARSPGGSAGRAVRPWRARPASPGSTGSGATWPTGLRALSRRAPFGAGGDGTSAGCSASIAARSSARTNAIVSIDGLDLKEFDYIDIGAMLDASGAVPVVIKSLISPAVPPSPGRGRVGEQSEPGWGETSSSKKNNPPRALRFASSGRPSPSRGGWTEQAARTLRKIRWRT